MEQGQIEQEYYNIEVPIPTLKGYEVMVKMAYVQLGKADLQVSTIGKLRGEVLDNKKKKVLILGSLGTGTVMELGQNVMGDLTPGDRVVLEPRIHCGNCNACQERKFYMCNSLLHAGIPPKHGMLQNYFNHPWYLCHKLPKEVSLREGSYSTTVAHCLQAYKSSRASLKSRVVIIGAGMAGTCLVKIFSSLGVKSIAVLDVNSGALNAVKNLGANYIFNTKVNFPPLSVVDEIIRYCNGGSKTDIVLDTVQSWASARLAAKITKFEGTILLFDQPSLPTNFNYIRYIDEKNKLLNVIELNTYGNQFKQAIHFLKNHQHLCDHIPPYEVSLDRGIDGLSIARSKLSNQLCVIIKCDPSS